MISHYQPTQSWLSPKIAIRDAGDKGKGMFAVEPIEAGERVLRWDGTYTNRAGAEAARARDLSVIQWDEDLYSVEDPGDDQAYFINHACDSNAWMEDACTLIAKRNIAAGEEITADYALWEANHNNHQYFSKWTCHCGAKDCRGRITGDDWRLPAIQARYQGHFSPLINRLIAKQAAR